MSKKLLIIGISLFLLVFTLLFFPLKRKPNSLKAEIKGREFILEIAGNDKLRSKGLSGRNFLPEYSGMLFIFDNKERYNFWMKEMRFPLDFIWIDVDTVSDLSENIPPPERYNMSDLPVISPKTSVDKVIEVNAGTINKLKLKIGDRIIFK